jgi:cytochrome d ubiquinol oxidase subunit I
MRVVLSIGILTTEQARATNVNIPMLSTTLIMYISIYIFLITSFILLVFYLAKKASLDQENKLNIGV